MARYLVWRVFQILPMLWLVGTALFILVQLTPGGPVIALGGEFADRATVASIERQLGLDRPVGERYIRFLVQLASGDLGQSYFYRAPVLEVVLSHLPATLILICPSLLLAAFVGVPLGILAARGGKWEPVIVMFALLAFTLPIFWLGHLVRLGLAVETGWLPVHGMVDPRVNHEGIAHVLDVTRHALLPWLTLTPHQLAFIVLLTKSAMSVEILKPYFVTTLAFGNSRWGAERGHALPNAALPIIALFCNRCGSFLAGSVLVETVYAWPGLGQLVSSAIQNRDHPLILGIVLVVTVIT
ncbi:MAG TPA: ABC transporter permease, partial [Myxococcaceae bacterium]|nr:ABC transporter permease [Myxococcaceae bacterium]